MAINPIDIQTLYSSIDKVAKTTTHQQQGMSLAASIHAAEQNKQQIKKNTSVKELSSDDTQLLTVHKDTEESAEQGESGEKRQKRGRRDQSDDLPVCLITDPGLGTRVDISG
ncbi:MAG: hypothetical protein LBS64_05940 [Spirochaetaceae bacterium]|jgi:hypothetical protein|nr:hypothetical protein [Spirochaetaceae bacterium]